ncbi:ABC transporter permease [candidate division KSB1 bacterium]
MQDKKSNPSMIALDLLEILLLKSVDFGALGDYEEQFHRIAVKNGKISANSWLWMQVIIAFPVFFYNSFYGSIIMFKNYMKVALRNLRRQKTYALVNIAGLAAGMAVFVFFAMSGGTKLNADRFHENADRMYGVVQVLPSETEGESHNAYTPLPMLPALINEIPEIEKGLRILQPGIMTLRRDNDSFYESSILFVDNDFFNFFSFELKYGNPEAVLSQPNSIVISERVVLKYFGDEDPVGKVLTIENKLDLTVTGVAKDFPRTSSIRFEFLIPLEAAKSLITGLDDWESRRMFSIAQLAEGVDHRTLGDKLDRFMTGYIDQTPESPKDLYLFPFGDFRLHSDHIESIINSTNPAIVYVSIIFGGLLLAVVSINFINLSIARYMYRAKEIGLRKVVGAKRSQLFMQFLGESILISLIAIPFAVLFYELMQPVISSLLGGFSSIGLISGVSNSMVNYPFMIKYLFLAALIVGIFSGLYPALFLSKFHPVEIFSGSPSAIKSRGRGRRLMIILQFSFSVVFILIAGVLQNQAKVLLGSDFGFDRENVAVVRVANEIHSDIKMIENELSRHPGVISVSAAGGIPVIWAPEVQAIPDNKVDEAFNINAYGVDYDFIELMGIEIVKGRSLSEKTGDENSFVINEEVARRLNWVNPIGRQLSFGDKSGLVVGVVEDFVFTDVGFEIPLSVFYLEKENLNSVFLKYSEGTDVSKLKEDMKESWMGIFPNVPFESFTMEEHFSGFFGVIESIVGLLSVIGFTAMLFAALGLLGIASYLVEKRTKEIGIRKVLGSSNIKSIWVLIKEFIVLVAVSNLIAFLLIYFGWKWVLQFGLLFVTGISPSVYIIALLVSGLSAGVAVTSQTFKAVNANPVDTLRYE